MPQLGFSQPFDCADYIFRFQFRFCLRLCFWDIMIICKCWHLQRRYRQYSCRYLLCNSNSNPPGESLKSSIPPGCWKQAWRAVRSAPVFNLFIYAFLNDSVSKSTGMIFAKFAALVELSLWQQIINLKLIFFGFDPSTDVATATKFCWFYQLSSHDIR